MSRSLAHELSLVAMFVHVEAAAAVACVSVRRWGSSPYDSTPTVGGLVSEVPAGRAACASTPFQCSVG